PAAGISTASRCSDQKRRSSDQVSIAEFESATITKLRPVNSRSITRIAAFEAVDVSPESEITRAPPRTDSANAGTPFFEPGADAINTLSRRERMGGGGVLVRSNYSDTLAAANKPGGSLAVRRLGHGLIAGAVEITAANVKVALGEGDLDL